MNGNGMGRRTRALEWAHSFVTEVRRDIEKAARDGEDIPPRIRSIHERPGHATPEYRTIAIPIADSLGGESPEVLSRAIARYAREKAPSCIVLALDVMLQSANGESSPVLIAEVRDQSGARYFLMQPYEKNGKGIEWGEPFEGGWREPGDEEMILDASFAR